VPASLALIAFVYGAAIIGQGLASDEMFRMRAFIECLVRKKHFDKSRDYKPGRPVPQETQ